MKQIVSYILKILGWLLMLPVYFYKFAISPFTPASCRHEPTCSQYAIDAIKIHGPFKGIWLGTKRIAKCHPWGTHGYDPVPPKNVRPIPTPSPDSTGPSTEGGESKLEKNEQINNQ